MSALESRATTLTRDATSAPISAKASESIARWTAFRREGEYWSIAYDGDAFRLRDTRSGSGTRRVFAT